MERHHEPEGAGSGYFGRPEGFNFPSEGTSAAATPTHRTDSPEGAGPFADRADVAPSPYASAPGTNPFTSPDASRPVSEYAASSGVDRAIGRGQLSSRRWFHSRRIQKGEAEKPWLEKQDPKEKWVTILPLIGMFLGFAVFAVLVWDGYSSVVQHKYCSVLDEDFSGHRLNEDIWFKEIQVGGFGNGEFEQTTGDDSNVYIKNGNLVIEAKPQDDKYITNDYKIDLQKDGTCTGDTFEACVAATNTTAGNSSIVPPVLSGRINTKKSVNIKYGRVEVEARMPSGKWLWPAIWMMPVDDLYGPWPASGEIDICESRGNDHTYPQGGRNIISSALHWGPLPSQDGFWRTNNKRSSLHSTFADDFHLFGLEWSQKYIFMYVDNLLLQVMYTNFNEDLWERGSFPAITSNGTRLENPWVQSPNKNAPFDQPFYLIMNLAVGGTNGWFANGVDGKPWLDGGPNSPKDFWSNKDEWLPTWTKPTLEVKSVKMLQQCDGDENLHKSKQQPH